MADNKTIVASAVALVLVGGLFFVSNKPITVNVNPSDVSVSPPSVIVNPSDVSVTNPNNPSSGTSFGALAGPDIPYNYFCIGGVCRYTARMASFNQSTSTLCAMKNPAGATSTLVAAGIDIKVASTTASKLSIGKVTPSPVTHIPEHASSTKLTTVSDVTIAANVGAIVIASTSQATAPETLSFTDDDWITFGLQPGAAMVGASKKDLLYTSTGTCWAEWIRTEY